MSLEFEKLTDCRVVWGFVKLTISESSAMGCGAWLWD